MTLGIPDTNRAVVVVPDLTRPMPLDIWLPAILAELASADVTVIIALGLHRRLTAAEIAPIAKICATFGAELRQHDPDSADLICTRDDPPGWFAPELTSADLIVCLGVVEPHQYAGFSGGIKGLGIGCAGRKTIDHLHSLKLLRAPGTGVGTLLGNPFQQTLWEVTAGLPPVWGVFVVPRGGVYSGWAKESFEQAVQDATQRHFLLLDDKVPWVRLMVPSAKATNFYQASRAATYASLTQPTAVVDGGWLVVEASCPEGVGDGIGERAFAHAMSRGSQTLLKELQCGQHRIGGGEQRAYVIAKTMQMHRLAVVSLGPLQEVKKWGIPVFETFEVARTELELSGAGITIEDPFHQVPRLVS